MKDLSMEYRSMIVHEACSRKWGKTRDYKHHVDKYNKMLVYERQPELITNNEGLIVGVDAWVRLYDRDAKEIEIDPHRRIINPPTFHSGEEDPLNAFEHVVWNSILYNPNPKGWNTSGTVDTIFPTLDGRLDSQGATYDVARDGTGTVGVTTTTATTAIGQFVGANYSCYEQFWSFDTSAIVDTDVVSAIDFSFYLVNDVSNTDFIVEIREKDWGTTLDSADFVSAALQSTYTLVATLDTATIGSSGSYKTCTTLPAFFTTTNLKSGNVRLFAASSRHRTNNSPPLNEYLQVAQSSTSGTTQDPKLVITHSVAPTFSGWGIPLI